MKVVVAVDSFKGSMTSMEAGMAVKAVFAAKKDAEVIVNLWLTVERNYGCADRRSEGERVDVTVTGPYHEPVQAYYGHSGKVIPQSWKWQQQQVSHQIRRSL